MTAPDTARLAELLAAIDTAFAAGKTAAGVIAELVEDHGATLKEGNTNTLRLAGVTGTCSWSKTDGLLGSWRKNAEKRLTPADRGIGDNSRATRDTAGDDRLRLLLERIERLEEEKKGIADDIKDVFGELKAVGYDAKIARQILRLRKMAPDDRREMEMLLETYKCAVGMD